MTISGARVCVCVCHQDGAAVPAGSGEPPSLCGGRRGQDAANAGRRRGSRGRPEVPDGAGQVSTTPGRLPPQGACHAADPVTVHSLRCCEGGDYPRLIPLQNTAYCR